MTLAMDVETQASPFTEHEVARIRKDFPILRQRVNGNPLIYLDNAATSQKPQCVIDALNEYYTCYNSNVHRGVHQLSQKATTAYESARETVRKYLNAPLKCEIIFTRGTTEGINLIAYSFGRSRVKAGDEILVTYMEHHSNIVPWQILCEEKGARLRVAPMLANGELDLDAFARLINPRTKLAAVTHVSNALGTVNPVREMADMCHAQGVPILVDGAQSSPHMPVDINALGCDFFVLSGHKVYGPTGIGVLYGRAEYLDVMPPWQAGGDMILSVRFDKTVYNTLPHRFEAGTPDISGAIGLAAAFEYLMKLDMARAAAYERELLEYATELLEDIPGVRIIGTAPHKAGVLSFYMEDAHPHDIGQLLDDDGIAIRAGHHCAQPVMEYYGVPATARASLAFYNTRSEMDALAASIRRVGEFFA